MKTWWHYQQQKKRLQREIGEHLDFIIGSVSTKGPSRRGYNLTYKENQVTKSRHIRTSCVKEVRKMSAHYKKLKKLLGELSRVNFELLCHFRKNSGSKR